MAESQAAEETAVPSGGVVTIPAEGAGITAKLYYCDKAGPGELDEVWFYDHSGKSMFHTDKKGAAALAEYLTILGGLFSTEDGVRSIVLEEISSLGELQRKIKADECGA